MSNGEGASNQQKKRIQVSQLERGHKGTRERDSFAPPYLWLLTISDKIEKIPS